MKLIDLLRDVFKYKRTIQSSDVYPHDYFTKEYFMKNILQTKKCPKCGRLVKIDFPTQVKPDFSYYATGGEILKKITEYNWKCGNCGIGVLSAHYKSEVIAERCNRHSKLNYRLAILDPDKSRGSHLPSLYLPLCMDCATFICNCDLIRKTIDELIPYYWKFLYTSSYRIEFTDDNCDYCKGSIPENYEAENNHAQIFGLKYLKEKYFEAFDFLFANGAKKCKALYKKREELRLYGSEGTEYFYQFIYPYLEKYQLCVREAQNQFREKNGLPRIGEGWLNETLLFNIIKKSFPQHIIHFHRRPNWLNHLEIDIFIPTLNLGIEYMGIQHYKPIDFFGGKEAFEYRKKTDLKKLELCKKRGVNLIYFSYEEKIDLNNVQKKLKEYL